METKITPIKIPSYLKQRLKEKATKLKTTVSALIVEAIILYLGYGEKVDKNNLNKKENVRAKSKKNVRDGK